MLCISGESHGHINFTLLSEMPFDEAWVEVVQQTTTGVMNVFIFLFVAQILLMGLNL